MDRLIQPTSRELDAPVPMYQGRELVYVLYEGDLLVAVVLRRNKRTVRCAVRSPGFDDEEVTLENRFVAREEDMVRVLVSDAGIMRFEFDEFRVVRKNESAAFEGSGEHLDVQEHYMNYVEIMGV